MGNNTTFNSITIDYLVVLYYNICVTKQRSICMDKKEFDIKIRAMLKYNKEIHAWGGGTTETVKRLNYLIIEMLAKGCAPRDIYKSLCTGRHANRARYDLLCRITEQCKYPTLVYCPDVTYTDDLKSIKNTAMDESRVRASRWMKTIGSLTEVSENELYRFTQCYMLLEQFGREETVIDETAKIVHSIKPGYFDNVIGHGYHDRRVEIEPKYAVIAKLACCDLREFGKLQAIMDNGGCQNIDEYRFVLAAYNSADSFFALKTKFDAENVRGVQGDTAKYVFMKYRNGIPYSTNKYREAYSMADAAREAETRSTTVFSRISAYANSEFYESTETPDDDTM